MSSTGELRISRLNVEDRKIACKGILSITVVENNNPDMPIFFLS